MTAAGQTSHPRFSLGDVYAALLADIQRNRAARLAREQAAMTSRSPQAQNARRDDTPPDTSGESAQQAAGDD